MTAHQPADGGNRIMGVLGSGDGPPGRRKQRPSGFGQLHLPGAAHEQVAAKFALERANRAGQARLREVGPRRRAGEVTFLGDRHKVRELPQLHSGILSLSPIVTIGWTNRGVMAETAAMTDINPLHHSSARAGHALDDRQIIAHQPR